MAKYTKYTKWYRYSINLIEIYIKNKLIIWDFIYHLYINKDK